MKNKEEIRSASWYPMDEGDIIKRNAERIKELEARVKELERELQDIADDAAGEDL